VQAAPGRPRPSWATFVYYYLAALIGAIVIISGGIRLAGGITKTIFPPRESPGFESFGGLGPGVDLAPPGPREERTEGVRDALEGILIAGVGAPIFWWHLNEARRREGDPPLKLPTRST
jgi:hypothetical protein